MGFSKAKLGLGHISWWVNGDFMGLNSDLMGLARVRVSLRVLLSVYSLDSLRSLRGDDRHSQWHANGTLKSCGRLVCSWGWQPQASVLYKL